MSFSNLRSFYRPIEVLKDPSISSSKVKPAQTSLFSFTGGKVLEASNPLIYALLIHLMCIIVFTSLIRTLLTYHMWVLGLLSNNAIVRASRTLTLVLIFAGLFTPNQHHHRVCSHSFSRTEYFFCLFCCSFACFEKIPIGEEDGNHRGRWFENPGVVKAGMAQ